MSEMTVEEFVEYIKTNFSAEQCMLAMNLKTEQQAREMLANPIMYPAFMTKHIHNLAILTGHKLRMIL